MVSSSCLIYSVRLSLNAAWAWRFLCLRSSEVAYNFFHISVVSRLTQHIPLYTPLLATYRGTRQDCNGLGRLSPLNKLKKKRTYRLPATFPFHWLSVLRGLRGFSAMVWWRRVRIFWLLPRVFLGVDGHLVWHDNTVRRQLPMSGKCLSARIYEESCRPVVGTDTCWLGLLWKR